MLLWICEIQILASQNETSSKSLNKIFDTIKNLKISNQIWPKSEIYANTRLIFECNLYSYEVLYFDLALHMHSTEPVYVSSDFIDGKNLTKALSLGSLYMRGTGYPWTINFSIAWGLSIVDKQLSNNCHLSWWICKMEWSLFDLK